MRIFIERLNLKPCSFCGSIDVKRVVLLHISQPNPMKVKCNNCGFESGSFHYDMNVAASEWNEISNFIE